MLKLHAKVSPRWEADPFVVRIATSPDRPESVRHREALLEDGGTASGSDAFRAHLTFDPAGADSATPRVALPESLRFLEAGDIVRVVPRTPELVVLYRRASGSNSIFATENCNSNCVMCSQPPRDVDDRFLIDAFLEAIPLMDPRTPELGITGGEPTLLGDRLLDVIHACKMHLPETALHMLSNGRLFNYLSLCQALADVGHPDLVIGIPLYSDLAAMHDFVVQAKGAFDQTLRGIINLKRYGIKVELRIVLHRYTVDRLPSLARFIVRNLPNVDHVALMGLEMMGYVKMNLESLWIDPADYQQQLAAAVTELAGARMNVSIYNHQLCVLEPELWPYARKSISDWKNEFFDVCDGCAARDHCGGFFASARLRYSDHVRAFSSSELQCPVHFT